MLLAVLEALKYFWTSCPPVGLYLTVHISSCDSWQYGTESCSKHRESPAEQNTCQSSNRNLLHCSHWSYKYQRDAAFLSLFGARTLHVSDALCVHHQEHYKL